MFFIRDALPATSFSMKVWVCLIIPWWICTATALSDEWKKHENEGCRIHNVNITWIFCSGIRKGRGRSVFEVARQWGRASLLEVMLSSVWHGNMAYGLLLLSVIINQFEKLFYNVPSEQHVSFLRDAVEVPIYYNQYLWLLLAMGSFKVKQFCKCRMYCYPSCSGSQLTAA